MFESFLPENLIEHLQRQGCSEEFCRKATTRKWAIREADRLNRIISAHPELIQERNLEVSLPTGFTDNLASRHLPGVR